MIDILGPAEVFIDLIVRHGPPRSPQLDRTLRLSRHLKVLVFFMLLLTHQAKILSHLPSLNQLADKDGYTPSSSTAFTAHASPTKKILAPVPDSIRNLMTACRKNLPHGLDIANLFPPDLWGYVHGFSY